MKLLKTILLINIGGAVGIGAVELLIWLVEVGRDTSPIDVPKEETGWGMLALCIALAFVFLFVGGVLNTILHELGHMIGGLATGYRFLSFRVFKWMIVKGEDGYKWKKFNIPGTLGQCIMVPPTDEPPYLWYNIGGVLVNLLTLILSILMIRTFGFGVVWMCFWLMMAFTSLYLFVMNGIPLSLKGLSNDGRNICLLYRHPENKKYFAYLLLATAELSKGVRLSDMPKEWFVDEPLKDTKDYFVMSNRMSYMALQEDLGNYDKAREIAEEMMAFGKKLPPMFAMEIGSERVMLELMTHGRKEVIDELWTKQLQRYTKASSKYSSSKLAVLYTYEMLYNHDIEAAKSYLQQLKDKANDFSMPGEAKTAMVICDAVKAKI